MAGTMVPPMAGRKALLLTCPTKEPPMLAIPGRSDARNSDRSHTFRANGTYSLVTLRKYMLT